VIGSQIMTISRQDTSQIIFLFSAVKPGLKTRGDKKKWPATPADSVPVVMETPRFTTLRPEGSFNTSKDIVERLLMDNMQDEVFILEITRSLDPVTRAAVRKALDQMAQRSRHIGQHLIDVLRVQAARSTSSHNKKYPTPALPSASQT
jgi:hypothetical protein